MKFFSLCSKNILLESCVQILRFVHSFLINVLFKRGEKSYFNSPPLTPNSQLPTPNSSLYSSVYPKSRMPRWLSRQFSLTLTQRLR